MVILCGPSEVDDLLVLAFWLFPIDETFGFISPNAEANLLSVLDMLSTAESGSTYLHASRMAQFFNTVNRVFERCLWVHSMCPELVHLQEALKI